MFRKPLMAGVGVAALAYDTLAGFAQRDKDLFTRDQVREILAGELGPLLNSHVEDYEWRYKQARDLYDEMMRTGQAPTDELAARRQITAEDLNLTSHQLTGYTVNNGTNGVPVGTSTINTISWSGLSIVYGGVTYTITAGVNLATKYHWFQLSAMGAVTNNAATGALTSTNVKPALGKDDVVVFINLPGSSGTGGTCYVAGSDGGASLPGGVRDNAVDGGGLLDGAAAGAKIGLIPAGKLDLSSISNSNMFLNGVVDNTAAALGAFSPNKLNILNHILQ